MVGTLAIWVRRREATAEVSIIVEKQEGVRIVWGRASARGESPRQRAEALHTLLQMIGKRPPDRMPGRSISLASLRDSDGIGTGTHHWRGGLFSSVAARLNPAHGNFLVFPRIAVEFRSSDPGSH